MLQAGATLDVVSRPSRGLGLPEGIGDFLAVAVRLRDAHGPGRHQDLLMNTSVDVPLLHHVFLPAPRWFAQTYSTCLPYRTDAGTLLVGLIPPAESGPGPSVDALRSAVAGGVEFGVALAGPFRRWERIGTLRLDAVLDPSEGDIDFDPLRYTGADLQPAPTWLQDLRSEAYRRSRRGRGAPREPRPTPRPDPA